LGRANRTVALSKIGRKWLKLKVALAFIAAILMISVGLNGVFYLAQKSMDLDAGLQKQANNDLQGQVVELRNQLTNLTSKADYWQSQSAYLQGQNAALKTQVLNSNNQTDFLLVENANLKTTVANLLPYQPNRSVLVTRLGTADVQNSSNSHNPYRQRLYVQGTVFNLGDKTAYNARLHVILYIEGKIVGDTYIELGNIEPLSWTSVSQDIYYEAEGQTLTNWNIIPETKTT
jgi:hypothetical protein